MNKESHFVNADGHFDNAAYQAAYRRQHPERRALWRLQAGLNECKKNPVILDKARIAVEAFLHDTVDDQEVDI